MSELLSAIKQVCDEKKIEYDLVISAIESSLAAAYRKDYGNKMQNIKVTFDPETGKSKIYDIKTIVEDLSEEEQKEFDEAEKKREAGLDNKNKNFYEAKKEKESELNDSIEVETERKFNPKTEIQLKDALLIKKDAKVGGEIVFELEEPVGYGRMAAQTAKQVIIQKLREIEKETVFNEFKDQEGQVINGIIQRIEGRLVFVDLDKAIGILPLDEQIMGERYTIGSRLKVYVKEVRSGIRGAEIILSRKSEEIVRQIFTMEIPEVANGLVEIKNVAREAGSRSKVAISSDSENIDPVGSCVGQRGVRIQTIINELGGEKVDIIEYSEDPAKYISNALAPAKILGIEIDNNRKATVKVAADKLSLAIGKNGQNVRLAARLTGWKIDIISQGEDDELIKFAETENNKEDEIEIEKIGSEEEILSEENHEVIVEEKTTEKKTKKTTKKSSK